jgi:hypothetical protein
MSSLQFRVHIPVCSLMALVTAYLKMETDVSQETLTRTDQMTHKFMI